jgi:CDP-diglyceride synthetase
MKFWDTSLQVIAEAISLLLPIAFSGLTLILCMRKGWLKALDRPLDGGLTLRGEPLIGKSKSVRSLVVYLLIATSVTLLLNLAAQRSNLVSPVYLNNPFALGPLITLAYLAGEILNSFVKRRLGIATSGQASSKVSSLIQRVFDNVDGILATGFVFIYFQVPASVLLTSGLLAVLIHLSTDLLMRRLKLKRKQ